MKQRIIITTVFYILPGAATYINISAKVAHTWNPFKWNDIDCFNVMLMGTILYAISWRLLIFYEKGNSLLKVMASYKPLLKSGQAPKKSKLCGTWVEVPREYSEVLSKSLVDINTLRIQLPSDYDTPGYLEDFGLIITDDSGTSFLTHLGLQVYKWNIDPNVRK